MTWLWPEDAEQPRRTGLAHRRRFSTDVLASALLQFRPLHHPSCRRQALAGKLASSRRPDGARGARACRL